MAIAPRRNAMEARICAWCRQGPIPDAGGVVWLSLDVIVHQGPCGKDLMDLQRVYDRSLRGRLRPRHEILAVLDQRRKACSSYPQETVT
jgi:hypothetical protein